MAPTTTTASLARPAWVGEHVQVGIRMIVGRDHVAAGLEEIFALNGAVGFDIETRGTEGSDRYDVKVATFGVTGLVVALDPKDPLQLDMIVQALERATALVVHNAQFDIPVIVAAGWASIEIVEKVIDTFIMSRLANPGFSGKHDLAACFQTYLDIASADFGGFLKAAGMKRDEWYAAGTFANRWWLVGACEDTADLVTLALTLRDAAIRNLMAAPYRSWALDYGGAEALVNQIVVVAKVVLRSSCRGLAIDPAYAKTYAEENAPRLEEAAETLKGLGITPDNGAELITYLGTQGLDIPSWPTTKTGAPSSEKKHLSPIMDRFPVVETFLFHKEVTKTIRDYHSKIVNAAHPVTGRVYPTVDVLGAGATGRQSAKNPPVQQLPGVARRLILADDPEGWVSIDWTSIEPRISAYASGDQAMIDSVDNGGDTYVPIARRAGLIPHEVSDADAAGHPGRKAAKQVLLGLMYGSGVPLLATQLGLTVGEAGALKKSILDTSPEIARWMNQLRNNARSTGMAITAAGRALPVGDAAYLAQNYFHQGSGADALHDSLAEIHAQGLAHAVRLMMHDEIVVDARYADQIEKIMQVAATRSLRRFTGRDDITFPTDAQPLPHVWDAV